MHIAKGILTARGGMTSHAAVLPVVWENVCVSALAL
jgi:phosphoenolpyruvate synthase/pyruvate phosphate dikinase